MGVEAEGKRSREESSCFFTLIRMRIEKKKKVMRRRGIRKECFILREGRR